MTDPLRLDAMLAELPDALPAWIAAVDKLVATAPDLAEIGFSRIMARFPTMPIPYFRHARAAERRGDWIEAERRWRDITRRFPTMAVAVMGHSTALNRLGKPDQSEALLREILARPPGAGAMSAEAQRALRVELGRLLVQHGAQSDAHDIWNALLVEAPEDPVVRRGHGEMTVASFYSHHDEAAAPAVLPAPDGHPHAELLCRFEGIGANCEFAFVQRHFGAEPIGLLRWAGIGAPALIQALQTDLAGIGEPEFTELRLREAPVNEIIVHDTRYVLAMHTCLRNTGQDMDKLLAQITRRMRFSRRKLLEDLGLGEKIFVYRIVNPAHAELIPEVLAQLKRFNPGNSLLAVDVTQAGQAAQPVQQISDHLFRAAIGSAAPRQLGDSWTPNTDSWLSAAQTTWRMRMGG